jgi:uncharacterized cupin superfamily protein
VLSVHEHVHAGEDEMFYLLEGDHDPNGSWFPS